MWVIIFWLVFIRVRFFKKTSYLKFFLKHNGVNYNSETSTHIIDGIENKVKIIHLYVNSTGTPFVYKPHSKSIDVLTSKEDVKRFIISNCGGEKALNKINLDLIKI